MISICGQAQTSKRIIQLEKKLDSLQIRIPALTKTVDFSLSDTELPVFIRAMASEHKLNVSIANGLNQLRITQNFSDATVKNVLLYLCKEYQLDVEAIGSILSIKRYRKLYTPRQIVAFYDKEKDLFSINLRRDTLFRAFKEITDKTGKNLVFVPGLENQKISSYIKEMPFDSALDKIAIANQLSVTKTKDNYYLFKKADLANPNGVIDKKRQKPGRRRNGFYFKVQDSIKKVIDVDFENIDISEIVKDISYDLDIDMFTTHPLKEAGKATVTANNITFDVLLKKVFENTDFSYNKNKGIYFFGKSEQLSIKNAVVIPLLHRSIDLMTSPIQSSGRSNLGNSSIGFNSGFGGFNSFGGNQGFNGNNNFNNNNSFSQNNRNFGNINSNTNRSSSFNSRNSSSFQSSSSSQADAILSLVPQKIIEGLDITTDVEQNAFLVNGDAQKIESFRTFLKTIDKPIPVILIEVMILEVRNSSSVSAGLELGIADEPRTDGGSVYPNVDLNLGATSINKVIGGFDGFGSLNIGKVVPNFYARIQALESNGHLKVKSTPKLSTLNGHQATLSRGERSYYAVTQTNTIGTQNPIVSDVTNYFPIDADLSIGIRPIVSGDKNITLNINVQQSDFNGERIDPEAPPGMDSREFSSIIRVKNQDVIILGGIEETAVNNSGSGVPLLARIPIIKWLFSKRTRTKSKNKLSILIKPTIIE